MINELIEINRRLSTKAHNTTLEHIRKDIEKLVKEKIFGNWFHTLKKIDSSTIPTLFQKFKESFTSLQVSIDNVNILFCLCVIEKKWACMRHFSYNSASGL